MANEAGASALLAPATPIAPGAGGSGGPAAPGTDATPAPAKIAAQFHFGQGIAPPEGVTAISAEGVMQEQIVESYRRQGVTDENVLKQVRERTPVTEREVQLAQYKRDVLRADKGWVKSYLDGDREARRTMALLNIVLASPVLQEQKS
jgi:hypothetical protein